MRGERIRHREATIAGYPAVEIENELISVSVLPSKGGEIHSLVHKPRNIDVLWKAPWDIERGMAPVGAAHGSSEAAWMDFYGGGWQDIFPNGGDACVYNGAPLGFHGEASIVPWPYQVRQSDSRISLEMNVRLRRSPFALRRTVAIEAGQPALSVSETITNEGKQPLHYMWGQHPAFGAPFLGADCVLRVPGGTYRADALPLARCRVRRGESGAWPVVDGVDLSQVPGPESAVCEFGYLCDLSEGWYTLYSRRNSLGFRLAWPVETFPYLWLWQEMGGSLGYPWYGRCYVMAVEPFSSIPGYGLVKAIEAGTAPRLEAGQSVSAELQAVLYENPEELAREA